MTTVCRDRRIDNGNSFGPLDPSAFVDHPVMDGGNFRPEDLFNEDDRRSIDQVKTRLRSLRPDVDSTNSPYLTDFNILRWLRAFDYDLSRVLSKLIAHLTYRRAMRLDGDVSGFWIDPILANYCALSDGCCWPGRLTGGHRSDQSSALCVLSLGRLDCYGLKRSVNFSRLIFAVTFAVETYLRKIMLHEAKTGRLHPGMTLIFDCDGLKLESALSMLNGWLKSLIAFLQQQYVEILRHVLIINGGTMLSTIFRMLPMFVGGKTVSKVKVLGKDWRDELLMYVDPTALPVQWNGSSGRSLEEVMLVPKPIPSICYYRSRRAAGCLGGQSGSAVGASQPSGQRRTGEPDYCKLRRKRIGAKSNWVEECRVTDERSSLQWWLTVEDGELTFAVFYSAQPLGKDCLSNMIDRSVADHRLCMVYPKLTLRSDFLVPERGLLECARPGFYYVELSNPHTMLRRSVLYNVRVVSAPTIGQYEPEIDDERPLSL